MRRLLPFALSHERTLRSLVVLGLAIALVQVLIAGPYFQLVASAIAASGGTLYSSIYGEQVAPFLSWSDWVVATWSWPYILCALLIAASCGYGSNKKKFLLFGTIAAFMALSILDLFATGLEGFGLSLACNLAGGLIIASWLYLIAVVTPTIVSFFGNSNALKMMIAVAWPTTAGLATSLFLYVILRTFLHPTAVDMNVDVEVPFNGYYSTDFDLGCYAPSKNGNYDASCEKTGDERLSEQLHFDESPDAKFSLLSNFDDTDNFFWLGRSSPLVMTWKRNAAEESNATINLAQGCMQSSELMSIAKPVPGLRAEDTMQLDFGSGMFQIRPVGKSAIAEVEIDENGFAQFSVSADESDPNKISVSRFVTDAAITLKPNISGAQIEVGIWPQNRNKVSAERTRRTIKILADQKAREISFKEPKLIEPAAPVKCAAISVRPSPIQATTPYVSVVLALNSKRFVKYTSLRQLDQIYIPKVNGWVQADHVSSGDLEKFAEDGSLHVAFLNGAFSKLEADGKDVSRSSRALLSLYGNLHASIRDKTLTISGKSVAAYVNGRRVNMTRWEKLGDSFRLAILGGIPAFIAIFWRRLRKLYPRGKNPWEITRS